MKGCLKMDNKMYNLTFPQQNILFMERFNENSSVNVITGLVNIYKDFNEDLCKKAINEVIEKNIAMRTRIMEKDNEYMQYFEEYKNEEIEVVDMSSLSNDKIRDYIDGLASQSLFSLNNKLYDFKVLKYSNDKGSILMRIHHIISDAWSCGKIGTYLIQVLESYEGNVEIETLPSYIEYIESEEEYKNSDKYEKDEEFWKDYLEGINESVSIKEQTLLTSHKAKRYSVKLEENLNSSIINYCKENRISSYALFLSALSTYIYRIKDKNDFVLGTPVLNRANFKEKKMLGMFVSTLPLRVKLEENENFLGLAQKISKDTLSVFRHQKYPYMKTLESIRQNSDIKGNLNNIVLSYQNARTNIVNEEKYSTSWAFSNALEDELQIHITDMDDTGILNINYDYKTDLYKDIEIEYFHTRLLAIIENAIEDKDVNIENIRIMSKEEESKILNEFNNTYTDYPRNKTVIELFEEQVEKTPESIALVFENKTMTYKELNEKANKVAYYISNILNLENQSVISIFMDKSIEIVIAILGILKANCIYLPLEKTYPKERINYIIENSSSSLVITDVKDCSLKNSKNINTYILNSSFENAKVEKVHKVEDSVYIMYTSGTTGEPKGVEVTNRNIVRLVKNTNYISFKENDRIIQTGSIGFDASTLEIWGTLLNGLTLYLIPKETLLNPSSFEDFIITNKISVMWLTAPLFNKMVDYNVSMFSNLRVLLIGGDVLSVKHVNKFLDKCKNVQLVNGYGPTENTTFSCCFNINEKCTESIPIGKPIANSKCYIVDKKYRLLPMFVEGELLVSGDGVAKGYFKDDIKTKKSFVKDPFNNQFIAYKTGDNAYFLQDGNVKFAGRIDTQIKIRGFRIELDEIKNVVLKNPKISDCYVTVVNNGESKDIILLYTSILNLDEEGIKEFLKKELPYYMIPKYIFKISSIPLNKNGKVDKKELEKLIPKSYNVAEKNDTEYVGIYKELYELFCDVLKRKDILPDDNFFEIGGDSLLAIDLVTKAISKNISLTYNELYKNPTIKQLGGIFDKTIKNVSISQEIETLDYTNIDELLKNNQIDENLSNNEKLGNVLLTGVTGFLGAHILDEYMKQETGTIYCLVRTKNGVAAEQRLKQRLNFFFGNKYDNEFGKRIVIIQGDMNASKIINNESDYEIVKNKVNTIINSAANVRHFGNIEKFRKINEYAVKNIIKFCIENNKKLIHISTLSVSGNILETGQVEQTHILPNTKFCEENFYINQNLDNVYAFTKFMGEKYVLDAIAENKLNGKIMRMGNLTGRMYDGKFQPNVEENAFANRLKTFLTLNVIPDNLLDFYLEFTPIDFAAKAVITLSKTNSKYSVFHIFNHKHVQMVDALKAFKSFGINLQEITKEEMTNLITKFSRNPEKANQINGIILDVNKNKEIEYKPNIIVKSDFTIKLLKSMGFEWPVIDEEYIHRYLNYLIQIGFLKDIERG